MCNRWRVMPALPIRNAISTRTPRRNGASSRCRPTGPDSNERHQERQPIGRARINPQKEAAIRAALASGKGVLKVAREQLRTGGSTVQRIRAAMNLPAEQRP